MCTMKKFNQEELEMIQAIRDINNDQSIDPYEALEAYEACMESDMYLKLAEE